MGFNPSQGAIACPSCGNQIPVGAGFCPSCGQAINATQAPLFAPPATPPPPPPPPAYAPGYPQPQAYGQPPAQQPQSYGPVPGYPAGYAVAPTPASRNSAPIYLALGAIVLVVAVVVAAVSLSSAGGPHATPRASAIAVATATRTPTPTPTSAPTSTPEPVTPVPTEAPTPYGTSWDDFSTYVSAQMDKKVADNTAWNAANNGSTTFAAATKLKADDQADLAWLQAHPPMDCYLVLYNDLILYDNQDIKGMNDWFAGKYTTFNKVDNPALTAIWNRLGDEFDQADAACS